MKKSISKYIKNGLFFLLAFILATYILLEVFAPDKTIDVLRYKSYVVVTASMEPDIMVNDMIIVHKVKEEDLSVRDAITFNAYIPELGDYSKVTHYIGDIEEVDDETIIYKTQGATKDLGDYDVWKNANNDVVEISYDDIDGRVVLVIPYMGYAVNILRNPVGLLLIVANVGIVYLLIKVIKSPKQGETTTKKFDNDDEN